MQVMSVAERLRLLNEKFKKEAESQPFDLTTPITIKKAAPLHSPTTGRPPLTEMTDNKPATTSHRRDFHEVEELRRSIETLVEQEQEQEEFHTPGSTPKGSDADGAAAHGQFLGRLPNETFDPDIDLTPLSIHEGSPPARREIQGQEAGAFQFPALPDCGAEEGGGASVTVEGANGTQETITGPIALFVQPLLGPRSAAPPVTPGTAAGLRGDHVALTRSPITPYAGGCNDQTMVADVPEYLDATLEMQPSPEAKLQLDGAEAGFQGPAATDPAALPAAQPGYEPAKLQLDAAEPPMPVAQQQEANEGIWGRAPSVPPPQAPAATPAAPSLSSDLAPEYPSGPDAPPRHGSMDMEATFNNIAVVHGAAVSYSDACAAGAAAAAPFPSQEEPCMAMASSPAAEPRPATGAASDAPPLPLPPNALRLSLGASWGAAFSAAATPTPGPASASHPMSGRTPTPPAAFGSQNASHGDAMSDSARGPSLPPPSQRSHGMRSASPAVREPSAGPAPTPAPAPATLPRNHEPAPTPRQAFFEQQQQQQTTEPAPPSNPNPQPQPAPFAFPTVTLPLTPAAPSPVGSVSPTPNFEDFAAESLALISRLMGAGAGPAPQAQAAVAPQGFGSQAAASMPSASQASPSSAAIAALEDQLRIARAEASGARRERDELIRLCCEHEESITRLRDRETRTEVEIEGRARVLEARVRAAEGRHAEVLRSYEELSARYGEVKKRYQAAVANEGKFKEAMDDFEARASAAYREVSLEYQAAQARLAEALAEASTLRQQMQAKDMEAAALHRANEETRHALLERSAHTEQYRLMCESLRAQLDATTQQLGQANLQLQRQGLEGEGARVQLQEMSRALRQYQGETERIQAELEAARKENKDLLGISNQLMMRLEAQGMSM